MYHLNGTDYLKEKYYQKTMSVCPECMESISAEIVEENNIIWMKKTCQLHGDFKDIISTSPKYYKWTHYKTENWSFLKNSISCNPPDKNEDDVRGCPHNCGICTNHLSNCTLALIDLTNRCNFNCNFCFANINKAGYLVEPTIKEIDRVMKHFMNKPNKAPAIMFSGGEPTVRSDFAEICAMAKRNGYKEVIVATNGYGFQQKKNGLEWTKKVYEAGLDTLYLQFDGINDETYEKTRGIKNLMRYKIRVIENCRKVGLKSIVLVATIAKGVTDKEIGNIIEFAKDNIDVVRGVIFQPVSLCGRINSEELSELRITNADVIKEIEEQTNGMICSETAWYPLSSVVDMGRIVSYLTNEDLVEFTCHPDCGFATYLFKDKKTNELIQISEYLDLFKMIDFCDHFWKKVKKRKENPFNFFSKRFGKFGTIWDKGINAGYKNIMRIRFLLGMLRRTKKPGKILNMVFKILLSGSWDSLSTFSFNSLLVGSMHFQDLYNMDIERVRRCLVHFGVAMPDGSVFEAPFCTMNSIHRPSIEKLVAKKLTEKVENEFDTSKGIAVNETPVSINQSRGN
ncbi:MAG: tetraether lipid synthase Tes [Promethearchaeota archaeon]